MTMQSTLEQTGRSVKNRRETCRLRRRQQIVTVTIGRRQVGIPGILHGLTIREICFFSELGPISVTGGQVPDNKREKGTEVVPIRLWRTRLWPSLFCSALANSTLATKVWGRKCGVKRVGSNVWGRKCGVERAGSKVWGRTCSKV